MFIQCSDCDYKYIVNSVDLKPDGRMVECANCNHRWYQEPLHAEELLSSSVLNVFSEEGNTNVQNKKNDEKDRLTKEMVNRKIVPKEACVLILGATFKENCPDIRNSKVLDLYWKLQKCCKQVFIHDPWVSFEQLEKEHGIKMLLDLENKSFDGVVIAVKHGEFIQMGSQKIKSLGKKTSVIYDLKYLQDEGFYDLSF